MIYSLRRLFRQVILAGVCGLVITTGSWAGEPRNIHLGWTDGVHTDAAMTVTWMESTNEATGVQYGITSGIYDWQTSATGRYSAAMSDTAASPPVYVYVHSAEIQDLSPDTLYYYRCGNEENWSGEHTFKTGPAKESPGNFRFVVGSDSHSKRLTNPPSRRHEIAYQIRRLDPRPGFLFFGGDEISGFDAPGEPERVQWDRFFSLDDGPDNEKKGEWARLLWDFPYMGSDSNHVRTHASLFDLFRYPAPWDINRGAIQPPPRGDALDIGADNNFDHEGNRYWYSFKYGNAHFIVLQINTGDEGSEQDVNAYEAPGPGDPRYPVDKTAYIEGSPQYRWLKQDLETVAADPHIRWKFAIMHATPYSAGGLARAKKIQETICRLLTKHNVDIAFSGHRHRYERSHKISNTVDGPEATGHGTPTEIDVADYDGFIPGVVYIVSGGAGGGVTAAADPPTTHEIYTTHDAAGAPVNYYAYNYVVIDVDNDTGVLTATARGFKPSYDPDDGGWKFRETDFANEVLLDTFTIRKPLRVVSGEAVMPGVALLPVDIVPPVDRDRSFVVLNSSNNRNQYLENCGVFMASGRLNADGSKLEIERGGTAYETNVSYHIVQSRHISVKHGSAVIYAGTGPQNRSISVNLPVDPENPIVMERSMVVLSRRSDASRLWHDQTEVRGYLSSDTELRLERAGGADADVHIEWSVVTFAPGTLVQTDDRTFEAAETDAAVELGIPIDASRSWLYFTVSAAGGEARMEYQRVRGRITDADTLTFSRDNNSGTFFPTVRWYVVQFPEQAGAAVYHASDPLTAAEGDNLLGYYEITPPLNSFIYHSVDGDGAGSAFARTYWINRFVENGIEFQRWTTGMAGKIDWQVVKFPD